MICQNEITDLRLNEQESKIETEQNASMNETKSDCEKKNLNGIIEIKKSKRTGIDNSFYGKKHSEEAKRKMSEAKKGAKNHQFGKTRSDAEKAKNNYWQGKHLSIEHKVKLSKLISAKNMGKTLSEETKRKIRVAMLKRLEQLKIEPSVDRGAKDWFFAVEKLGYNFTQNYMLKEIGYMVDGYDAIEHIVVEYDTPYHVRQKQKERDAKRQNHIIAYFESKQNPLKAFVRVDATNNYQIKGVNVVYGQIKRRESSTTTMLLPPLDHHEPNCLTAES